MPLYEADVKKQKPIVNNNRILVKKASVPAEFVVQGRPDYIVINSAGTFKFMYETTSSLGTSLASIQAQFVTGSVPRFWFRLEVFLLLRKEVIRRPI